MPHPEHAVEDLTGAGTDGLGFFTSLAALVRGLRLTPDGGPPSASPASEALPAGRCDPRSGQTL